MAIDLSSPERKATLEEEYALLQSAVQEMHHAIRWYVTTLSLAILTHGGELIINNNLLDQLEDKEVNFNVKEIEGKAGMVKVIFKVENEDVETLPNKEED